jgi:hypothetical protein
VSKTRKNIFARFTPHFTLSPARTLIWIEISAMFFFSFLIGVKCVLLFFQFLHLPPFTPDSWGYFDTSQQLFIDFYKVHYIRQFLFFSDYSLSFPPLYPFLIAALNTIHNFGIYAGYFLNFLMLPALLWVLLRLSKKLTSFQLPGLYLFLLLISTNDFVQELTAARSLVLASLLFASLMYVFLEEKLAQRQIIILGGIAGALAMTRFDFLLPLFLFGIFIPLNTRLPKFSALIKYFLPFLLFLIPWIVYSEIHFGQFFSTDNQHGILLATKTFTSDYVPNSYHFPTFFTHPFQWFIYRLGVKGVLGFTSFLQSVYENIFIQQLGKISLIAVTIFLFAKSHLKKITFSKRKIWQIRRMMYLLVVMLFQLFTISLPGYLDMRYTLPFLLFAACALLLVVFTLLESLLQKKYLLFLSIVILACTFAHFIIFPLRVDVLSTYASAHNPNPDYLSLSSGYTNIKTELSHQKNPTLLVDVSDIKQFNAAQFASLSNIRTLETPNNLNKYTLLHLVKNYPVTYYFSRCPKWTSALSAYFQITATSIPYLYAINPTPSRSVDDVPVDFDPDRAYLNCE